MSKLLWMTLATGSPAGVRPLREKRPTSARRNWRPAIMLSAVAAALAPALFTGVVVSSAGGSGRAPHAHRIRAGPLLFDHLLDSVGNVVGQRADTEHYVSDGPGRRLCEGDSARQRHRRNGGVKRAGHGESACGRHAHVTERQLLTETLPSRQMGAAGGESGAASAGRAISTVQRPDRRRRLSHRSEGRRNMCLDRGAAGNVQGFAGDPPGVVRGQERDGRSDVVRLAYAA